MKCCVPSCGVTSAKHPSLPRDRERATFQQFPTIPWLKKAWLERIAMRECELPQGAVICSQHFLKNDLFPTRRNSGIIKLRQNSVPSVFKSNAEPSAFEFCMICLDPEPSKLYVLKENHLAQTYTDITGLQIKVVQDLINTVPKLCAECAHRLTTCAAFKHKMLTAHDVLIQLLRKDKIITAESIKSVNRVDNSLMSHMVKRNFKPDHCDLRLVHNEGDGNVQQEHVEKSEDSDEIMSAFDAKDYLNDLDDAYNDKIIKIHELDDDDYDDDDCIGDFKAEYLDDDIEYDPDDVDDDIKYDPDDVDDDSEHDNDVDVIIVKHENGTDDVILEDIDINIDNIGKLLNKEYINESLLNKLKADNNTKNRISLDNVIFVKDAKPIINHKGNANRNFNTRKCKSVTNNKKLRIEETQKEKIKTRKEAKGTDKQNEDTLIQETNYNNDPGVDSEKSIITRSKSKILAHVKKNNANVSKSKSIETHEHSGAELELFTRTTLTYEEQIADVQNRKYTERYGRSPYKCDICFKGFWQLSSYNLHMDKHTNKFGHLECAICGVHTKSFASLRRHLSAMHSERYSCALCQFTTSAKIVALSHEQWHRGKTFDCPKCDAKFRTQASYFSHVRIKHPSQYACVLCGYSFISPKGVKLHIKLKHRFDNVKKVSGPSCLECKIRFASNAAYQQHLKVSSKHAVHGNQLMRNAARSTRGRPQPRQENQNYKFCPLCEKAFSSQAKLREHMCLHTGERPYRCEKCGRGFIQKANCKLHIMRKHTDNPLRFPCEVCSKEFSSVSNRARHVMMLHTDSRPEYKCDTCDKTFLTSEGRDRHVIHVHHKVPWPKRDRPRRHTQSHEQNVTRMKPAWKKK